MAEEKSKEEKQKKDDELIPMHTKRQSFLIMGAIIFGIIAFIFLKNVGIRFELFLTPISTFQNIVAKKITIDLIFLIVGLLFLSLSFAATVLFSLIKEKKKRYLFIIPPCVGIAAYFLFGPILAAGAILSYFVIEFLISKDKRLFKKISINYLINHSVGKAMLVINLAIALAVMFALLNTSTYAKMELNNMMASTLSEDMNVDNLKEKMIEQQKNTSMSFANSIIDSVENAFDEAPVCRNAIIENRQSINEQIEKEIDSQLATQNDKFEKIDEMVNIILKYYPYLTAITLFAILQLFNVIVIFGVKTTTLVSYKFLKKHYNFSVEEN